MELSLKMGIAQKLDGLFHGNSEHIDDDWGYPLFSEQAMKKVFGNHEKTGLGG